MRRRNNPLPPLQIFDADCGGIVVENLQPIKVRPVARNVYDELRENASIDPVSFYRFLSHTGLI